MDDSAEFDSVVQLHRADNGTKDLAAFARSRGRSRSAAGVAQTERKQHFIT